MPQAIIGAIIPYVSGFLATIGASTAFVVAASGVIAAGLVYGGLALAAYAASAAFAPDLPKAPKPEDGKFNLKQTVPSLVYVLGPNKKAGDYVFLEEKGGTAHHVTVWAAHHIMLNEAVIEVMGRPTTSLRNQTIEFEGIVVPGAALYAFNAATEEGVPGSNVEAIAAEPIPVPNEVLISIGREAVSGGAQAAFAEATFTSRGPEFQYELEWQPTSGGAEQRTLGSGGAVKVRSSYLADGVEYRFRARTWSVSEPSEWTDYQVLTATADPVAPGAATDVSGTGGAGQVTINWTSPNSSNYVGCRIYLSVTNDFADAELAAVEYGAPNAADSRVVNGFDRGIGGAEYAGYLREVIDGAAVVGLDRPWLLANSTYNKGVVDQEIREG